MMNKGYIFSAAIRRHNTGCSRPSRHSHGSATACIRRGGYRRVYTVWHSTTRQRHYRARQSDSEKWHVSSRAVSCPRRTSPCPSRPLSWHRRCQRWRTLVVGGVQTVCESTWPCPDDNLRTKWLLTSARYTLPCPRAVSTAVSTARKHGCQKMTPGRARVHGPWTQPDDP